MQSWQHDSVRMRLRRLALMSIGGLAVLTVAASIRRAATAALLSVGYEPED